MDCAGERQLSKPGRQIASNQELFANGLAAYQKVIEANYMAHCEVYGLLHGVLMAKGPGRSVWGRNGSVRFRAKLSESSRSVHDLISD
jgi:hypothetical protein